MFLYLHLLIIARSKVTSLIRPSGTVRSKYTGQKVMGSRGWGGIIHGVLIQTLSTIKNHKGRKETMFDPFYPEHHPHPRARFIYKPFQLSTSS